MMNWRERLSGNTSPLVAGASLQAGSPFLQQDASSAGCWGEVEARSAITPAIRRKVMAIQRIQFFFCMVLVFVLDESRNGNVTASLKDFHHTSIILSIPGYSP